MKAINRTPTPHTHTTTASLHNLLLLYKSAANGLNNAHKNPVTIKYDIQSPTVQVTEPCQSTQRGKYPTYAMLTGFVSKSSSSYSLFSWKNCISKHLHFSTKLPHQHYGLFYRHPHKTVFIYVYELYEMQKIIQRIFPHLKCILQSLLRNISSLKQQKMSMLPL